MFRSLMIGAVAAAVLSVAAFVAVSLVATWMGSWACAQATHELAPYGEN